MKYKELDLFFYVTDTPYDNYGSISWARFNKDNKSQRTLMKGYHKLLQGFFVVKTPDNSTFKIINKIEKSTNYIDTDCLELRR